MGPARAFHRLHHLQTFPLTALFVPLRPEGEMNAMAQFLGDLTAGGLPAAAALGFVGKVLCLCLACGLGPYLYLVPARLRGAFVGMTLLPALGMGCVLVAAVHCVWLGAPLTWAGPGTAAVSAACLACGLRRPRDLADRLRALGAGVRQWKYHLGASAALAAVVISPGFRGGLSQPLRVGPDELGYAITGQYLLDGGNRKALESRVVAQTGKQDREAALLENGASVDVTTNVASEFLLRSMRWYSSGVVAILAALGERYVLPVQFLLLFFPLVLLFGVAHHFLRTLVGLSEWLSVLGAASVVMNVNLLNVLCEGQHAQVFGGPFFFLLLGQLYFFRNSVGVETGGRAQEYMFTCLLSTVVLCAYPELMFLTAVLTGLVGFLDLVLARRFCDPALTKFGLAVAAGFVIAGGYSLVLPVFYWKHLANMQTINVGFWQPQWALPAEILGLFNIYDPAVPEHLERVPWDLFGATGVSILCVEVVLLAIVSGRRCDYSYWLAPLAFIAVVFVKVCYVNGIHNYQYMKAYTLLMLPVLCFFFGSLHRLSSIRLWPRLVLPVCMVWMMACGWGYLRQYADEALHISCSPARADRLRASVNWDDYVWVTPTLGLDQLAYASLVPFNWINMPIGPQAPNLTPHYGKKIGIWLASKQTDDYGLADRGLPVLYEDDQMVLYDTGLTLQAGTLVARKLPDSPRELTEKEKLHAACGELLRVQGCH
jgi:hypothetical protein